MPKSVVVDDRFDWGGDTLLDVPQADSVIYEVHVKGFSKLCPEIPEELRGTYAALGTDVAIDYFKKLGVTAIELLPVHHFVNDQFLEDKKLTNYWGYNSIGYFAPHSAYAKDGALGGQVTEFKEMVKRLHAACGIEVHSRRGLQSYRRGQSHGADADLVPRGRQCRLLPPWSRMTVVFTWITLAPGTL